MGAPIASLPRPLTRDGQPRRVGIEVECGGLTEQELGRIAADELGGTLSETGDFTRQLTGSEIGDLEIMLDTFLRDKAKSAVSRAGLDLGRAVVPVEFITDPILPDQIEVVDRLCTRLAREGATGTGAGLLLGFGLHLNIELAGKGVEDVLPVLRAYAFAEDWLRRADPIDTSRRVLPFVQRYPPALLDRLAEPGVADWTIADLVTAYGTTVPSRNHGLDMLPALRHLDEARLLPLIDEPDDVNARPAYHYRLPDCRIDDPDWSVAAEWARWCGIERIAARPELLEALAEAWRDHRARLIPIHGSWARVSGKVLDAHGITP